jgi:hypothetical protein
MDIRDFANVRFDKLSTGTKQKLSLSKALVNEPELLLLDEPTVALDPDVAHRLRAYIRHLHADNRTTISVTTHNMKEAEGLCEEVAFIQDGTIKAQGKPQDLKRTLRLGDTILIDFQGVLVCILLLIFGYRAEVAAWSLVSLMLLPCGIYYPVSMLPGWVGALAELIPLTYFLEDVRQFYGFEPNFPHVLAKGYLLVVACLVLELYLMRSALRRAKRTGILLKLSE